MNTPDAHSMLISAARKYLASKASHHHPGSPDLLLEDPRPVAGGQYGFEGASDRSRSQPRSRPGNAAAAGSLRSKSQPRSRRRSPDPIRYHGSPSDSSQGKENVAFEPVERARARRSTARSNTRPADRASPTREGLILAAGGPVGVSALVLMSYTLLFAALHGKRRALHEILQSLNGRPHTSKSHCALRGDDEVTGALER